MKEERLQILRMIQDGTITPEDGAKLLAALTEGRGGIPPVPPMPHMPPGPGALFNPFQETPISNRRWLRIRVTDTTNERVRVNVTIPIGLLDWGLKMAQMSGVNLAAIREAIHGGAEGKILEVDESESGDRVEIFVE
ncbi:MAG: hypothetical protein H0T73_19420 [Ardenticatenales bacterium]|nr:hypothetical protein [Ardenticatenales bacterium]